MNIVIGNISINGKDFKKILESILLLILMVLMHVDLLANIPYTRNIYIISLLLLLIVVPFKDSVILGFCFTLQSEGFFLQNGMMLDIMVVLLLGAKSLAHSIFSKQKFSTVSFLGWLFVFLINIIAIDSFGSFAIIKTFFRLLLLFMIVNSDIVIEEEDRKWTAILAFLSVFTLAIMAFKAGIEYWGNAMYINRIISFDRLGEAYRVSGGADSIGFALCIVFPILLERISKKSSVLWIALCIISFIIGVLSKSRVFLLTAVVVFIVFVRLYSKLEKRKKYILYVSVIALFFGLLYISTKSLVFSSALSRFSSQIASENSRIGIWGKMLNLWSGSVKNIFFGAGFAYKEIIGILAHNVWIEMLVAWGIVGLTSTMLLLFQSKVMKLSNIRSNPNILLLLGYFLATLTISSITYDKFYLQIGFVVIWLIQTENEMNRRIGKYECKQ